MTNKTRRTLCAALLATFTMAAGAGAQGAGQQPPPKKADTAAMKEMHAMGAETGWVPLDAFHKLMEAAWHPVAQGDFKAARAKAPEVLAVALAWRKTKGPVACDTPAARESLARLVETARWYADAVKREASDDAVRVTLKTTHDHFEAIAEPCLAAAAAKK